MFILDSMFSAVDNVVSSGAGRIHRAWRGTGAIKRATRRRERGVGGHMGRNGWWRDVRGNGASGD